jgi:Zn-dependent peptidase ImmA (M78 family)
MTEIPDFKKAQAKALEILDQFGYTTPPVDPVKIARDLGIRVFFADFKDEDDKISGFFFAEKNEIYVNKHEYPQRQTFTVAHELGHKFLHEDWLKSYNYQVLLREPTPSIAKDPKEKEADAFAAHLLVPKSMLDQYHKFASIEELAKLFMVSIPVIRLRLKFEYGK